jgi:hypothetical protein
MRIWIGERAGFILLLAAESLLIWFEDLRSKLSGDDAGV